MTWDLREREGERKRKCDMGFKREREERKNVTWDFRERGGGERKCDLGFQRERERESRVFVMGCKELLHCRDI